MHQFCRRRGGGGGRPAGADAGAEVGDGLEAEGGAAGDGAGAEDGGGLGEQQEGGGEDRGADTPSPCRGPACVCKGAGGGGRGGGLGRRARRGVRCGAVRCGEHFLQHRHDCHKQLEPSEREREGSEARQQLEPSERERERGERSSAAAGAELRSSPPASDAPFLFSQSLKSSPRPLPLSEDIIDRVFASKAQSTTSAIPKHHHYRARCPAPGRARDPSHPGRLRLQNRIG